MKVNLARIILNVSAVSSLFVLNSLACAANNPPHPTAPNSFALDHHQKTTPPSSVVPSTSKNTVSKPAEKPLWNELTPAQQLALSPLAPEWDKLEKLRKAKWLEIAKKFQTIKPEEQQRLHERMREWAKLTPEQRRLARENFSRANKIDNAQKSAQWQQYQQLSEEQKKKFAVRAVRKKQVANLPSASQSKQKTIAPIIKSKTSPTSLKQADINQTTPQTIPQTTSQTTQQTTTLPDLQAIEK